MRISKSDLLTALTFVHPFASKADLIPVIDAVHMKTTAAGLVLEATDLRSEARANPVSCVGNLDVCVNPALLKGFCERAGEEIDLKLADGKMQLSSGKIKASLKTLPGEDFPAFKDKEKAVSSLAGLDLSRMLADVAHASARNDVRYQLNGIAIQIMKGKLHVVATSGYTFAGHSIGHDTPDAKCILPIDIAERLPIIASAEILESGILFACDGGTIRSKIIDAEYPDWPRMMKKLPHKIELKTADFLEALDATRPFQLEKGGAKGKMLHIECDGSTMRLSGGENGDELTASLDADGDPCDAWFNAKYWQDVMRHELPEDMTIQFDADQFSVQHESWTGVIMRVRV